MKGSFRLSKIKLARRELHGNHAFMLAASQVKVEDTTLTNWRSKAGGTLPQELSSVTQLIR